MKQTQKEEKEIVKQSWRGRMKMFDSIIFSRTNSACPLGFS